MVDYARIQHHIDRGKGIASKKLGPPFTAYRVQPNSAGDFPAGWSQITVNFPLFTRRFVGETKVPSGLRNVTQWYDLVGNMEPYLLGDVFLQIDPPYQPGVSYGAGATSIPGTQEFIAYCLAWHPPVNKAIGGHLDRCVTVWRPAVDPAALQDGSDYWKSTHDNDRPLVLQAGQYAFQNPGSVGASLVPAGIASAHKRGDALMPPGVPGMPKSAHWFFYLPPLPGYMPREGDAIVDQNGARYVVASPYEQLTGLVGFQLLCDRKIAQPG